MTFLTLNLFIFRSENGVKGLRVTKNIKEIRFEGVWRKLESKKVPRDNNPQNICY